MPGITAGASPTPQHGGRRGWWGQARLVGAGEANGGRKPMPAALGRKPHKPSGQIPCQHAENRISLKEFFHLTLSLNPEKRTSDVEKLVGLLCEER